MTKEQELDVVPFGRTGSYVIKQKSPGFYASEGHLSGELRLGGCNLTSCWEDGERGVELVEGQELSRWLEQYDYRRWENISNYAREMKTLAEVNWEGHKAYKVRLIDSFGQENFYFFAVDTGFLIGAEQVIADLGSTTNRKIVYEDYTQFGPFKLAAKITRIQPSYSVMTTIKSVSFDEIPDWVFEFPDEVKRLMAK